MKYLALVGGFLALVFKTVGLFFDKDKDRRNRKKEIVNEAKKALDSGDASLLTAQLDRLRNVK